MAQQANESPENRQPAKRRWMTPVRVNLLVITILIAVLNVGIMYLAYVAITSDDVSEFVAGALVGSLPVGITALAGLGTTLLTDK